MAAVHRKYSCDTKQQTLEWIEAIVDFLKPYSFLMHGHVVSFFKDRLWEAVDKEWMDCLRKEPVENLVLIPSGVVQGHWPASLKNYIRTLKALAFPREQVDLEKVLTDLHLTSLSHVLAQGMNFKKKHEVEVLAAIISSTVNSSRAHTIVDVGAGQGYLAQVLSFQYQHSVVAIDSCSHHGRITDARAERIKKYYASQLRKSASGNKCPNVPWTITCQVKTIDMLSALTNTTLHKENLEDTTFEQDDKIGNNRSPSFDHGSGETSLLLTGLHACGDLSVTMLRAFLHCKEVKAIVSVGCCYNLLSEEGFNNSSSLSGFPMSHGVRSTGLALGKSSRDLACQSAERWRRLGKDAGLHNFELHAFRAAFEMVLSKYYPEVMMTCPSIGRQGKALRRQYQRRILESQTHQVESADVSLISKNTNSEGSSSMIDSAEDDKVDDLGSVLSMEALLSKMPSNKDLKSDRTVSADKYSLFENFTKPALSRLSLTPLPDIMLQGVWKDVEPFNELIGPYWSLRAALGPILETIILLDRLLFLQEQGSAIEAIMLPIFDPALSPRNVAIIATKVDTSVPT